MAEEYAFRGDFAGIGLHFRDEDEFHELMELAGQTAVAIDAPGGRYFINADGHGAELWLLVDAGNAVVSVHPYLRGTGRIDAAVTGPVQTRLSSTMDATLHAWAEPTQFLDGGSYPFLVTCIDWQRHLGRRLPFRETLSIAAFPRAMKVYGSVGEYDEAAGNDPKLASQGFIPTGLFGTGPDVDSVALFTGIVREASRAENPLTGLPYGRALVETQGGSIDVALDMQVLTGLPTVGAVLEVDAWLATTLGPPA